MTQTHHASNMGLHLRVSLLGWSGGAAEQEPHHASDVGLLLPAQMVRLDDLTPMLELGSCVPPGQAGLLAQSPLAPGRCSESLRVVIRVSGCSGTLTGADGPS